MTSSLRITQYALLPIVHRPSSIVHPSQAQDPSSDSEGPGLKALRKAMATLPPRHQAAVALALFEQMSASEIAGALGVRPARAMRVLRSGLKRIGRSLEAEETPEWS